MGIIIAIAIGGAIGALCRFWLSSQLAEVLGTTFPWGILLVNIAGCLAMGALAEASVQMWHLNPATKAFLMTGVLGGFTTFSAFALDTAVLTERGDMMEGMLYVFGSVGGSIAAVFLGIYLVRTISS